MNTSTKKHSTPEAGQPAADPAPPRQGRHLALREIALLVTAVLLLVAGIFFQLDAVRSNAARTFDLKGHLLRQYLEGRLADTRGLAERLRGQYALAGRAALPAGLTPDAAAGRWTLAATAGDGPHASGAGALPLPATTARELVAARTLADDAAALAADSDVVARSFVSANHLVYRVTRDTADVAAFSDALYASPAWTRATQALDAGGEAVVAGIVETPQGARRVALSAPVLQGGALLGVVTQELALETVQGMLASDGAPGRIILVDAQGQLLARTGAFAPDESYPVPAAGMNYWEASDGTAWSAMPMQGGRLYLLQRLSFPESIGSALLRALPLGLLLVALACIVILGGRLRTALAQVAQQSRRDPLTHALNRRGLFEDVVPLHALSLRNKKPVAVLTLDVDFFRQLNDQFGHEAGDRVLCALTAGLREKVREYDVVCRWSGEIFVVLLMVEQAGDAFPVSERLRGLAAAAVQRDALLSVTVSAGLAMWRAEETIEAAIGRAEEMLYAAKAAGRDRLQASGEVVRPAYAYSGEQLPDDAPLDSGRQAAE